MKRRPIILPLLILIILLPIVIAWGLVHYADRSTFKQSHHGVLLSSPPNITQLSLYDVKRRNHFPKQYFLGKWWIIYVSPAKCYDDCQEILYNLRQLQIALGKDAGRVARLFVTPPDCPVALCDTFLKEYYPELHLATVTAPDVNHLFSLSSRIYIVDPLGNIILYYFPDTDPRGILSDLKRLLRVSTIG